jgi:hypothetical protein
MTTTAEVSDNTFIYDIETFQAVSLFGFKRIGKEEWYWFEISEYKNELDGLVKWLIDYPKSYIAGFNNISFDGQVIQYILDTYHTWSNCTARDIVSFIAGFASNIISNQNYDIKPVYNQKHMDIAQIDLGTIHNFFNENKRTSLKWIEFMTDQIVDEMPFDHTEPYLTAEQCEMVRAYCEHDIRATETLWYYTVGNCSNELYKGKDKIQERLDAIQEFGLPTEAISYSDVKLGESVNLLGYMKESGKNWGQLYEAKKNRKSKHFTFGDCIPKYVKFSSAEMQAIRKQVEPVQVNLGGAKQEFPFMYHGLQYMIAKGGIHTENTPVLLQSTDTYKLIEFDAGSQYPSSIVKRGLYPAHLGREWLVNYKRLIEKRLDAKKRGKTDTRYKGIAETLKVSVNGGGFGMTNSTYSVQYDPWVHFQCTIGNQFEILMLIEWMVDAGIDVLSANTDGALCGVPTEKLDMFYSLCKKWEDTVLITEAGIGELEYTEYTKYVMLNVNSYLAIKTDGTTKEKKDFLKDYLLEKNKSKKMTAVGLYEYYVNGLTPEQTMEKYRNIMDYTIAVKASKDYYYRAVDRNTGHVEDLKKLVRYYCSTEGEVLWKMKHEHSDKTGPKQSICNKTSKKQRVFNTPFQVDRWEDYKVDTKWYCEKVHEIIQKIDPLYKRERKDRLTGQQTLF